MASLVLTVSPTGVRTAALRYGYDSLVGNDDPAMRFDLPLPGRYMARDQAPYAGALENGYPMDLSNERVANNYVTQRFPTSIRSAGVDTGNGQLMHVPGVPESPGEIPPYVPEVPADRRDYSRPAGVRNGIRIRKKDSPTTAAPVTNVSTGGEGVGAKLSKNLGAKMGNHLAGKMGEGVGAELGKNLGAKVGKNLASKAGALAGAVFEKTEEHSEKAGKEDTPLKRTSLK